MNPEEITRESLTKLNIKTLALNKGKFGVLTFDESFPLLEKLQKLFREIEELDYSSNVSQPEIDQIAQYMDQFVNHLRQLAGFDLATGFNKDMHDGFESTIRSFHDDVFRNLRNIIVYLRQEVALKSQDVKELQKQQKAALQAEKEYKVLSDKLTQKLDALEKREQEVEVKHGEIATKVLAHHFAKQANDYTTSASAWLKRRGGFYKWLILIISFNFLLYFLIFFTSKLNLTSLKTGDIFTIEYGIIKFALVSLLSYGLVFTSRNYSIDSNLAAVNRHRKNVAQTLEDFLETKPDQETKSQMIKQGTEAMFKHLPIGHIGKSEAKDNNPLYEIINNFIRPI